MKAVERALSTAEAQIEEAEATARIRNAYFTIVVSNAQALFGLFAEYDKRKALTQALEHKNTDSSMLHRGLILQINGIFESYIRAVCDAVLTTKSRNVNSFFELDEKIRNEYIYRSAVILTHAKDGNVRGKSYDFDGLKTGLAGCFLGVADFEIRTEVFTLMMGNCTPLRLSRLFEALCLTDPFDDRIGNHSGLKKCANEGAVNLTKAGRSWTSELSGSSSSGHGPPRVHRVTAELAHCLASDQMTLDIEGVVDGGVGGEKPLRRS